MILQKPAGMRAARARRSSARIVILFLMKSSWSLLVASTLTPPLLTTEPHALKEPTQMSPFAEPETGASTKELR